MRKLSRSVLGVTLLEVMLVLAIAAMIVVMSIRYYSSAQTSQQSSASMQQLQSVMAAMDTMGMAGGYTNASQSKLSAIVGANNMITATGGAIALTATAGTTYTITMALSPAICPAVASNLANNKKITAATCAAGVLSLSYDNTK